MSGSFPEHTGSLVFADAMFAPGTESAVLAQ